MNYIEVQKMRKEAGSFKDGMTMMNPFSHLQWMQDQIKRNGFLKAVTGHGDEGFVDYLGRTGKVDLSNEWTNSQRYNQFMNGLTPSKKAIESDYGTDLTSKLKALFGVRPLKFGLLRDNDYTKMRPCPGRYAAKVASIKQAAKDDSDIIAPAVAGGGTLLGSILYGRARGAGEAAEKAIKALAGHKVKEYDYTSYIGDSFKLRNGKKITLPWKGSPLWSANDGFAGYMRGVTWNGRIGRNSRIDKAISMMKNKGAIKGGRIGLYAGIPLALITAGLVNSWRSDKQ